jgi:hypothetical protein
VRELIDSFPANNPGFDHLVFDEGAAENFIGERLSRREVAAFRSCALPAMQSDYFRYCAVWALGGIYADADCECVGSLAPLVQESSGGELFTSAQNANVLVNGFFVFTQEEHPFLRLLIDVVTELIERRMEDRLALITGPWTLSALYEIARTGSLDVLTADTPACRRFGSAWLDAVRTVAAECDLAAAAAGITVWPLDRLDGRVREPDIPLPYKKRERERRGPGPHLYRH